MTRRSRSSPTRSRSSRRRLRALRDIVASKRWDASEIEQEDILDTVKELRKQIEILEMENQTLRGSRDMYQNRCAELIKINKGLQNKLKKFA
jgi:Spy/CpxP family protein refolding chaperone